MKKTLDADISDNMNGRRKMQEKKYEEIGTNYRFFLGWRHAAFAGDLIILYGAISLTSALFNGTDTRTTAWIVPALASPIGILLWIIDVRTRDLYHATIRAGKKLEGKTGGFYTQVEKDVVLPKGTSPIKKFSHTGALGILFIGSSLLTIIASFALYFSTH